MRKKIPLIGGIINLIESLKGDIGIIENGDTATHSISAGSYVIWKNELYKASSAIAVDDALSSSNLTAVSGGVGSELDKIGKLISNGSLESGHLYSVYFKETAIGGTRQSAIVDLYNTEYIKVSIGTKNWQSAVFFSVLSIGFSSGTLSISDQTEVKVNTNGTVSLTQASSTWSIESIRLIK